MAVDIVFDYRPYRSSFHISVRGNEDFNKKYTIDKGLPVNEKIETLEGAIDESLSDLKEQYASRKVNIKINVPEMDVHFPDYVRDDYIGWFDKGLKKYNFRKASIVKF